MITAIVTAVCILLAAGGVLSVKFFGTDNPVEQVAEAVIQQETGTKPDLDAEAAALGVKPPAKGATAPAK